MPALPLITPLIYISLEMVKVVILSENSCYSFVAQLEISHVWNGTAPKVRGVVRSKGSMGPRGFKVFKVHWVSWVHEVSGV